MRRPYVVCHMLTSLDGKISGDFMQAPETAAALRAYGALRGTLDCQATLYGTTTMLGGYADGEVLLPAQVPPMAHEDFITEAARAADQLIIALDPEGKLGYRSPVIEKKGRAPAVVVEALTDQAAPAYLHYLRSLGVSHLFCGARTIDVPLLLEKLYTAFGIRRLMLAGGGVTNGAFLQADCIDALSLVVAPVTSGEAHGLSVFECAHPLAQGFAMQEVQTLEDNVLWLRYLRDGQVAR